MINYYLYHVRIYPDIPVEITIPLVYTGFLGWGGGVPRAMGVFFDIREIKNFAFVKLENFQKNVKKSMKKL